ncbi:DUF935 domain-containing protein [Algihabitans albus]|uniref:DUF935 domain-containing protein n=1 Tax=Algihabitans albus TaxID=2164067 RepID=UPI0013C307E8|nr:DUF935 domain-containing protein [Algihabitans albus]
MARKVTLYDQWNRPIQRGALTREEAAPTTTGVRQVLGDHPEIGLTPRKLAQILREAEEGEPERYLDLAEAMEEKDLHYASVLGVRKRQVSQLPITVVPAGEEAEQLRQAEELEDWLEREELRDELIDILDATGKGFSLTEILWDTSERQWRPKGLEWRDPRWFRFDRTDGRTPLLRETTGDRPLTPFKYVFHCSKAKSGLPIRGGLARLAAWMYLFKSYTVKDWLAFMEVYGMPLRVGKYHAGATAEEKAVLLRAVRNIGADVGAIIPEGMMIDFVEAVGKGATANDLYEKFGNWADTQVSKGVLGQNLTTQVEGGSFAAANVHNEVRGDIEGADARQLSATLNRDLVRPFIDLNYGPQKVYPRLKIGREEERDLRMLLAGAKALVPMGARISRKGMMQAFALPEAEDEEDQLTAPAPSDSGPAGLDGLPPIEQTRTAQTRTAQARREEDEEVQLDPAAETGFEAASEPVERLVETLRARIAAATTFEEAQAALLELSAEAADPRLVELAREALVLAELQGMDGAASDEPES